MKNKLPKLDLNVTNRCNYRCVHCAFDSGEWKMPDLQLGRIRQILLDTWQLGGKRFDITGGEPLLRDDIEEIIDIGKELDYKIELVTNASLLTLERLVGFKQRGLDSIAISVDGHDYETYSKIRKVDKKTYKKVLESIDNVLNLGIPLKINTTVFESNYRRIPEIAQWCISKGIAEHGLYYFTPVGRGELPDQEPVEPLKWLGFIKTNLYEPSKRIKLSLEFPFVEKDKLTGKATGCLADNDQYHLHILPNGSAYPCAIMASYDMPLANLHKHSVNELWNNKKLWSDYWAKAKNLFGKFGGCCVDFSQSFDTAKYGHCKYVCPLRKFYPGDIHD